MRYLRLLSFLLLTAACLSSCSKKDDTDPTPEPEPVNWSEQLKNTVWTGQFNYTTGVYTGQQPFSISLSPDGTLTWSDLGSTRPGGTWKVVKDQATITFPNSTTIAATVTNDKWSNFLSSSSAGFTVTELSRAAIPTQASLANTTWTGSIGTGTTFKLKFTDPGKLEYTEGPGSALSSTYTIEGAGIRFKYTATLTTYNYYAALQNDNKTFRGIEYYTNVLPPFTTHYYTWITNKQ